MRTRILSFYQEEFLLKCSKLIEGRWKSGTEMLLQWDLQREMKFINRVLADREYSVLDDADRLNSIRNLYRHIQMSSNNLELKEIRYETPLPPTNTTNNTTTNTTIYT